MNLLRLLPALLLGLITAVPATARAQAAPAAQRINFWEDDDKIIEWLAANGRRMTGKYVVVWAPTDSMTEARQAGIVDTLDRGLGELRRLIGAPLQWQRIADRPVQYYLGPGNFISHGSGRDFVFISVNRALTGRAPWLHEALHELLAPLPPTAADSARLASPADRPLWIGEGMPSALAQMAAAAAGLREGDIWGVGDRAKVDSVCTARLQANPWKDDLLRVIGGRGRIDALYTTDRGKIAPTFYPCSESMSKFVIETIGAPAAVELYPNHYTGEWVTIIERGAGVPLAELQKRWRAKLGL